MARSVLMEFALHNPNKRWYAVCMNRKGLPRKRLLPEWRVLAGVPCEVHLPIKLRAFETPTYPCFGATGRQ